MARRANHKDQYRSTGWCQSLGGARSGKTEFGGNGYLARRANAESRSARMAKILRQYRGDAPERG